MTQALIESKGKNNGEKEMPPLEPGKGVSCDDTLPLRASADGACDLTLATELFVRSLKADAARVSKPSYPATIPVLLSV